MGQSSGDDADLRAGDQVGEYRVESRLGQGAFGTVYRAAHPLIGKVVAIKVLTMKCSVDPMLVQRFVNEARAVNQIRNRHIIDIFAFGQLADGRQYYVMEHLDGETLDALLEREGPLTIARAVPILRAVGHALDAAHAKNVVHRDLKPENIFLGVDPDAAETGGVFPKLLDFGIAKLLAPEAGLSVKTGTGVSVGTPYFMSPEQCRGLELDHRTDIYSFGVLAYLMLTGKYPFDADDYVTIMMGHVTGRAAPPSTHVAALGSAIDDAIAALLAKDPADRPVDLRTAVLSLEAAAAPAPAAARATRLATTTPALASTIGPSLPTARRDELPVARASRAALVAGVAALATVVAVVVVIATHHERAPHSRPPPESRPPTVVVVQPPARVVVPPPDAAPPIDAPPPDVPPPDAPLKKHKPAVDHDLLDPFH